MFELPNLRLNIVIVCFANSCHSIDKVLPRSRFKMMSGNKKFSLLVEWCTSSRFALIVHSFSCPLCKKIEPLLAVQELQVTFECMRRDTVTARDSLRSDWISIGDCEHFPGASQLVRTLPTGCRTYENVCPHRHASNPLLEETFLSSYPAHCSEC